MQERYLESGSGFKQKLLGVGVDVMRKAPRPRRPLVNETREFRRVDAFAASALTICAVVLLPTPQSHVAYDPPVDPFLQVRKVKIREA